MAENRIRGTPGNSRPGWWAGCKQPGCIYGQDGNCPDMRLAAPGAVLKPDAVMVSRARLTAGAHRGFYSPSFILSVLHV